MITSHRRRDKGHAGQVSAPVQWGGHTCHGVTVGVSAYCPATGAAGPRAAKLLGQQGFDLGLGVVQRFFNRFLAVQSVGDLQLHYFRNAGVLAA